MIKVLKSWAEVGEAIGFLTNLGKDKRTRVYHSTLVKNWDLAQIAGVLKKYPRDTRVLDMGCGGSNVLRYFFKNHFSQVYGIDLTINWHDRLQQLRFWKSNGFKLPYNLSAQSVTQTNFPSGFFDVLICLSVVEHNVNLADFFDECSRLLKTRGKLYLSTDYWDPKIDTSDAPLNYGTEPGKEWTIFSKAEIKNLIKTAERHRLTLLESNIARVKKPVVSWNTKKYTFISMVFSKKEKQ
ncbi:MAG: Methyltransferase type 11 [Candidatus Gottesmanbacteria bacterium GW2011_GWB1_43_11]|uniref:Methyltransferase type 11 n=1 Tax=Candidatus Gottesmanbacteria bacterium GW2011_GWB1_43_11 TaxID=1618446 RepID=A0A0G1EWS8_9BACT|nr:MAG: Methyltransferase type 11 [Candidatus Gottesmanbacteria bacterium GW2011_GWA2_42_16]KKS56264.1 MAG: Methyltransferase type 11 [Candidatus Gottesmanbacteria bacterium GW2011_GWA1_42_26]KKS82597.1 MAG: Methyltransferase type 11 [Candidatus Gottesmanbacteria bacterium GW2011_GWC1_43_10]KKS87466.1 MAG: Methyltransferase type 11 [Candidatus Gottesmanbacteria bacterium GW2011_GWB1_43_11]OGG10159.1 MAG: hypothetical protein A2699_01270 [Candidatus Gottesmanbacteria bacterium RIFCSPHIGHO2_01_FU